jgi:hypothetical protein
VALSVSEVKMARIGLWLSGKHILAALSCSGVRRAASHYEYDPRGSLRHQATEISLEVSSTVGNQSVRKEG